MNHLKECVWDATRETPAKLKVSKKTRKNNRKKMVWMCKNVSMPVFLFSRILNTSVIHDGECSATVKVVVSYIEREICFRTSACIVVRVFFNFFVFQCLFFSVSVSREDGVVTQVFQG